MLISIHAPREGSDRDLQLFFKRLRKFQSTLPVRGATLNAGLGHIRDIGISIHAPREGSDRNH